MQDLFAQIEKEWSSFRRDRLGLSLAIILPVATLCLFGYGVRLSHENIKVLIHDSDKSAASEKLIEEIGSRSRVTCEDQAFAKNASYGFSDGKTRALISIPSSFGENVRTGVPAKFDVILDGSDVGASETMLAVSRLSSLAVQKQFGKFDMNSFFVVPDLEMLINPGADETPFIVSGVFAIVLWMYPALLAAVSVSREFEQETIVQIYTSRLGATRFILGKAAVHFFIGLVVACTLMVFSHFVFGLRLAGDPSPLVLTTLLYVAAAVAFGLVIGVLTREENIAVQATATGGFFPALLLSGFVYPLSNIPFPLSLVSFVVPARYYIEVCRDAFMSGLGWEQMWWRTLLTFSCAIFLLAFARLRISSMQIEE